MRQCLKESGLTVVAHDVLRFFQYWYCGWLALSVIFNAVHVQPNLSFSLDHHHRDGRLSPPFQVQAPASCLEIERNGMP